jgi:glycosyltransferase involved in cell wall biosynthesis
MSNNKLKIVMMIDEYGWVYDNLAREVVKRLGSRYDFRIQTTKESLPAQYDLVHYATYALVEMRPAPRNKSICGLVGVHGREKRNVIKLVNQCRAAAYRSYYMRDMFSNCVSTPLVYIPDAIDTSLFIPSIEARPHDKPFTVGWNGNPVKKDKRFDDIRQMLQDIPGIDFKPFLRKEGKTVPYDKVPGIYHEWDCYVCYSSEEGFCIPLIEAAACGIPVISTDVGCASMLGHGAFIIKSLEQMRDAIDELKRNPDMCRTMGLCGRNCVKEQFDWNIVIQMYDEFFKNNLPEGLMEEERNKPHAGMKKYDNKKMKVKWVMNERKKWAFKSLAGHVIASQPNIEHSCGEPSKDDQIRIFMHPDTMQNIHPDKRTILRIDSNRWYQE